MNESPRRQSVIMGIFVALGIGILSGAILMIGGVEEMFASKIQVSVVFDEVSGLKKGDNIWFSGLQVGTVSRLDFDEGSQVKVELKLDEEAAGHIHQDAVAKIGSDSLIGNRIVVIYDGSPEAPTLQDGDVLAMGKAVSTDQVIETLQANNLNLLAITTDLKGVSADLAAGRGTLGKLLKDESLYASLTTTATTLQTVADNAQALTASLQTFSGKLNEPGRLPDDLVTDQETYASLVQTVGKLQETSEQAAALVDGLAKATADPESVAGALLVDPEAGTDLKATLDHLNESSALLATELDALQHSLLLRGAIRRQKRAAARASDGD